MARRFSKLTAGVLAAATLLAPDRAPAREIEIDEATITAAGTREGAAANAPWSGVWWPFVDVELAKGWNGTGADFAWDAQAKRWNRQDAGKAVNDRSPLLKYDEYVRLASGTDPQSALLECTGDEGRDFEHSVYGAKKEEYDREGISYSWWGHCNGWCGAALLEQEPVAPVEARGIRFEVADLKGLLTESYWGVESDFTGKRYNRPRRYIEESRDPQKRLLAALGTQGQPPVADYIAWYEKAWSTTMTASARAAARPEDFRDELETFDGWYKRSYDDAFADIEPATFHRILETVIGRKRLALVFDITANEEVWNHPAFKYRSQLAHERDFSENGQSLKEWDVTTTVWYATDGVSESILGISDFSKTYTYTLVTNPAGKAIRGEWTGSSVNNHPDFAWLPTHNPTGVDYGENFKVIYGKIREIIPSSHRASDARAIDLTVAGERATERRGTDRTTTWASPVAASGDVAIAVVPAQGRPVASVKYFEQPVSGSSQVTAARAALVPLGEGAAAPSFGATIRFASSGKKMVVAYGYDAQGRILGVDEITIDYSVGGSGTGTGTGNGDDSFEPNDTKAEARAVSAGSYADLQCRDDDWYEVTLAAAGDLSVRIDFRHSEGDLDMVLDGPGGQLAKSDSTANQETVAKNGLAAGKYHVRVYGYGGAKAKYAMTVTVTQAQGGNGGGAGDDDRFEPNDARAQAAAVAAGSHADLKCRDDDWFKVTLAQAGDLTVKIDFRHAEGDLDMVLQDGSGAQIAKSDSTADSERVSKTGLAAGDYFVRVYGYNGARAAYSMTVTVAGTGTGTGTGTGGSGATTRTGTVTAGALNVRSGPGTTNPVVTVVRRDTVVTVHETRGMWHRVTWSGSPAGSLWVYKTYVRLN